VFEEFYQVPGAKRGGTGLGLPYARRLARLLDGDLALTSQSGGGTIAVLRLPHGTPSVGTIVLADDDAAFRQVLKAMVSGFASHVIEAEDGAEALAAVTANNVHVVLMDLGMPVMDGNALLDRLPPTLPVIVITGRNVAAPPRAAALLHKDQLTRQRLAFAIRHVSQVTR
jgi:CheY-like chemotaxis protein